MKKALQEYFIKARILDPFFSNRKNCKTNQEKKFLKCIKYPSFMPAWTSGKKGPAFLDWNFCGQGSKVPSCMAVSS